MAELHCEKEAIIAVLQEQNRQSAESLKRIEEAIVGNGKPGLRREFDALLLAVTQHQDQHSKWGARGWMLLVVVATQIIIGIRVLAVG